MKWNLDVKFNKEYLERHKKERSGPSANKTINLSKWQNEFKNICDGKSKNFIDGQKGNKW